MPDPAPCGFLVLDKPAGLTSHGCVSRVRRAYGLRRVGHGGTLDPAVTGVLPIAVGPATRLLPYLAGDKTYRGVVRLGLTTSTDDLEGEVLQHQPVPPLDQASLERALEPFRGAIQQRPPQVSAVHVDGERAYARQRRWETLVLAARSVTIHRLELLGWNQPTAELELTVHCSAGTYIRALARDLGAALGCGGALARLRRLRALGFGLDQAVSLEALPQPLLDPLVALGHLPQQHLQADQWDSWRCGRALAASQPHGPESVVAVLAPDGNLAGMARAVAGGLLQPKLVFDAAG
ncbi:MAG: tRNA pseudouridine(55) synthase TruB [Cyanobacteriota bacterium]